MTSTPSVDQVAAGARSPRRRCPRPRRCRRGIRRGPIPAADAPRQPLSCQANAVWSTTRDGPWTPRGLEGRAGVGPGRAAVEAEGVVGARPGPVACAHCHHPPPARRMRDPALADDEPRRVPGAAPRPGIRASSRSAQDCHGKPRKERRSAPGPGGSGSGRARRSSHRREARPTCRPTLRPPRPVAQPGHQAGHHHGQAAGRANATTWPAWLQRRGGARSRSRGRRHRGSGAGDRAAGE